MSLNARILHLLYVEKERASDTADGLLDFGIAVRQRNHQVIRVIRDHDAKTN